MGALLSGVDRPIFLFRRDGGEKGYSGTGMSPVFSYYNIPGEKRQHLPAEGEGKFYVGL